MGHDSPDSAGQLSLNAADPLERNLDGADCAVCGFLALAHGLPVAAIDIGNPMSVAENAAATRHVACGDAICAYRSRAPPAQRL